MTDFGMSKLAGAAPTMTPLTMCPGTLAYMAPEALREPPRYTKKLDCFSEGVIMIQVCTRLWPEPGPRTQLVPDSRSPTGNTEMPVLETERRKTHIDLIDPNHALLPIAMDCLKYQEGERPSSEELCQRLADLKDSQHYRDNVRQHQDEIQAKDRELEEKDRVIQEKEMAIQDKDTVMERVIQDKDRVIQDKDRVIASQERQLRQLNQQLEEQLQEQVKAEIQHSLQRQVEQLLQLNQQVVGNVDHKPHSPKEGKVSFCWRNVSNTPFVMCMGAAAVDDGVAYFMNWNGQLCSYNNKWSELPKYPYIGGSLAVVNSQLTGIGGCEDAFKKHTYTNKLLSLHGSWSEVFPPMPTKRRRSTAVTSKEHLIVAGGAPGPYRQGVINTVEVMEMKTLVWSTVASLPHLYYGASATICGDHLYMLGGYDDKDKTKSVPTCSLTELLQSSSSSSSVWHIVAAPFYKSTCTAVNGQLLAVGGRDEDITKATTAIHKYNQRTNTWDHISDMPSARDCCLVAVLPTNEMMAVGGKNRLGRNTDTAVIASFSMVELK